MTDLTTVFNKLMQKARMEDYVQVNLQGNTIWLKDCGFGFSEDHFCVSPKGCDDNELIARWPLPKLRFWQSSKMQIKFTLLVKKIVSKEQVCSKQKLKEAEMLKIQKVQADVCKLIGLNND